MLLLLAARALPLTRVHVERSREGERHSRDHEPLLAEPCMAACERATVAA